MTGGGPLGSTGEDTDVKARFTVWNCIILAAVVAALSLIAAGCGEGPKEDPAKFVGTWAPYYGEDMPRPPYPETLVLRADGSASRTGGYDPHPEKLAWSLYRGKLVLTPREGTRRTSYDFHFNGPDELVVSVEGQEQAVTFHRVQEPPEGSPEDLPE